MSKARSLGKDGPGFPITLPGGEKITVLPLGQDDQEAFKEWMIDDARARRMDTMESMRSRSREIYKKAEDELDEEKRRKLNAKAYGLRQNADRYMEEFDQVIDAGSYDFGNDLSLKKMRTPDGLTKLLLLSAAKHHPRMTWEEGAKLVQDYFQEINDHLNYANLPFDEQERIRLEKEKKEKEEKERLEKEKTLVLESSESVPPIISTESSDS